MYERKSAFKPGKTVGFQEAQEVESANEDPAGDSRLSAVGERIGLPKLELEASFSGRGFESSFA